MKKIFCTRPSKGDPQVRDDMAPKSKWLTRKSKILSPHLDSITTLTRGTKCSLQDRVKKVGDFLQDFLNERLIYLWRWAQKEVFWNKLH